jgi:predicted phosphodiesterase
MKIAIISDIHEDLINLKLALSKAEKLNCNEIICLGDISGFSARIHHFHDERNAGECLKIVRENCSVVIAGNHDLHAAKITPLNQGHFKYPPDWYNYDFKERELLSEGKVWLYDNNELNTLYGKKDIEYIKTLPEYYIYEKDSIKILFSHFIYPNLTGSSNSFFDNPNDFSEHKSFLKKNDANISFSGHMHCHGLTIAKQNKIVFKRFNKKYKTEEDDSILIPSIVRNKFFHGFCIFDSNDRTAIAKRF